MQGNTEAKRDTSKTSAVRWLLVVYDALIYTAVACLFMIFFPGVITRLSVLGIIEQLLLSAACVFTSRHLLSVYKQIWRYGGMLAYIRLISADAIALIGYEVLMLSLPFERIGVIRACAMLSIDLLAVLTIRILYQYCYQCVKKSNGSNFTRWILKSFARLDIQEVAEQDENRKIKIAIVGAGRIGAMLAEELMGNPAATYQPLCFIDSDNNKVGREVLGIPVIYEDENIEQKIKEFGIQEVVFALGVNVDREHKRALYNRYKQTGCKVEVYDFPTMQSAETGKRHLRQFDIEELLFRQQITCLDQDTLAFYKDKVVMITGGGGSIGSELCRQIAQMQPKRLIILDVYENGAYDIQQELRIKYGSKLDLVVEIVTVCDRVGLEKVFNLHRPNIVLHAAAHKHVPLMERNVCEAVQNNVFGTLNVVDMAEKYKADRFIMISTDKAVNPTNVMGATKRMCEMIVLSRSDRGTTSFTATRFGNVLGSAGSVVPLFKRQIENGGPVTLTDRRIIRYFMTIFEASQLVLQSGAMAKNGELFVLDMGKPVSILELAESMIRLSGFEPYTDINIVETGLRPGEKLYEELLVKSEQQTKTDKDLIFVEKQTPLSTKEVEGKLAILREALKTVDNNTVKKALMEVVPSFKTPEEVNKNAMEKQREQRG